MHQTDFFPGNRLTDGGYGAHSKGINHQIHSCDLNQHSNQLFGNHPFAADRMGQQKFRCFILFFFTENTGGTKRCIKCAPQSQNIAALNSVKSDKCAKVQTVHTECLGKRAHGGEHIADAVHLPLHFREHKNTDRNQKANRSRPDQKGNLVLPQFVFDKCHAVSPSFS